MAATGDFGDHPLDGAIFADTQWEPAAVYRHLDWLESVLPFPVHRVTAGSLLENVRSRRNPDGGRYASIPWYVTNPDGSASLGRRQCTSEYKLDPITAKIRELLDAPGHTRIPPGTVEQWVGISLDEASRMKPARQQYIASRWPLIERRITRADCLKWLADREYPRPPRSACIGCPFHSQSYWKALRADSPDEFAHACEVDAGLRLGNSRGFRGEEYMHRARIPLAEAVALDDAQPDLNFFLNECEGMCGV